MFQRVITTKDIAQYFSTNSDALDRQSIIYKKGSNCLVAWYPKKIFRWDAAEKVLNIDERCVTTIGASFSIRYARHTKTIQSDDVLRFISNELNELSYSFKSKSDSIFFKGGLAGCLSFEGLTQLQGIESKCHKCSPITFYLIDSYWLHNSENNTLIVECDESLDNYHASLLSDFLNTEIDSAELNHSTITSYENFENTVRDLSQNRVETFRKGVETIQERLTKGDSFQTVISTKHIFDKNRDKSNNKTLALRAFQALSNFPSTYQHFWSDDNYALTGISPENLFTLTPDGEVKMTPLAGTRPAGSTELCFEKNKSELNSSIKDRAEHNMLVDLARNDLGRVCVNGSVTLTKYMEIERYRDVIHLSSEISGKVNAEISALEVMQSVSPAGTMSGAPKIRSIQIIQEIENEERGYYSGNIGVISTDGYSDFSILIRSIFYYPDEVSVQAGAGIVLGSSTNDEYSECIRKMYSSSKVM